MGLGENYLLDPVYTWGIEENRLSLRWPTGYNELFRGDWVVREKQ